MVIPVAWFYIEITITTDKKGLFRNKLSKFLLRFWENFSNSSCVWIGDLYQEIKLQSLSPIFNSKLRDTCKQWKLRTFKSRGQRHLKWEVTPTSHTPHTHHFLEQKTIFLRKIGIDEREGVCKKEKKMT